MFQTQSAARVVMFVLLSGLLCASSAAGANPEPLDQCKLPNFVVSLQSSYRFPFFDQLSLATGKIVEAGDVDLGAYRGRPYFRALSGRMIDLGPWSLREVSGRTLARPPLTWGRFLPRAGQSDPTTRGATRHVVIGHSYLIETRDGKFAIARLLGSKSDELSVEFQYVYQPDGSLHFPLDAAQRGPSQSDPGSTKRPAVKNTPTTVPTSPISPATTDVENLAAFGLPTGIGELRGGDYYARDRTILRFADGAVTKIDRDDTGRYQSLNSEYMENLRQRGIGDIFAKRIDLAEWRLFNLTGRIVDLGPWSIEETTMFNLTPPPEAFYIPEFREIHPILAWERYGSARDPKVLRPGATDRIEIGNTYLVQTLDNKYALLRVLSTTAGEVRIQYLFQPNGTLLFRR